MRIWGSAQVLTEQEIEKICEKALKVLKNIGVRVENRWMMDRLISNGAVFKDDFILSFPEHVIDDMLRNCERYSWEREPELNFVAGANPQFYMAAGSDEVCENTLASIERLTKLADRLDNITNIRLMGAASDVNSALTPLYARLFGWKHVVNSRSYCNEIWDNRVVECTKEMIEVYKDYLGKTEDGDLKDIIVYMISPLCLKKEEADRFENCYKCGFHVDVGSLCSSGGTAPITLAGALVQNLAEALFMNFINKVFYGGKILSMGNRICTMDMKHGLVPYGRPEVGITNLAMGQIARYFSAEYASNSFSAEAKLPSSEAGIEKAMSAITGIIAGSSFYATLGLLSVDEIISEEQLVIDNEFAGMLKRLAKGFVIDEETMAYDVINEVGIGGLFTGTEHTVMNFRTEHWQPDIYSRELYSKWTAEGRRTDRVKAASRVDELLKKDTLPGISEDCEKRLRSIIEKASAMICR